jgi:hypothetical protein
MDPATWLAIALLGASDRALSQHSFASFIFLYGKGSLEKPLAQRMLICAQSPLNASASLKKLKKQCTFSGHT